MKYPYILIPFLLITTAALPPTGPQQCIPTSTLSSISTNSRDFALFFASDTYQYSSSWRKLSNPIKDAYEIARSLEVLYGFKTEVIENPTLGKIYDKLLEYAKRTDFKDGQLLVYFSGHGHFDELRKIGYFIPSDGKPTRDDAYGKSYLAHVELRSLVSGIPCKHILLSMDACFSGTIDPAIALMGENENDPDRPNEAEALRKQRISDKLRIKTRLYITSGEKNYTPDPSEFAAQFKAGLQSLGGKDGLLDVYTLFHSYLKNANSKPQMGSFEGNEAGADFLFEYNGVKKGTVSVLGANILQDQDSLDYEQARKENRVEAYFSYARKHPDGRFIPAAQEALILIANDPKGILAVKSDNPKMVKNDTGNNSAEKSQTVTVGPVANSSKIITDLVQDSLDYNKAVVENSMEAYLSYARKHPDGRFLQASRTKMKSIIGEKDDGAAQKETKESVRNNAEISMPDRGQAERNTKIPVATTITVSLPVMPYSIEIKLRKNQEQASPEKVFNSITNYLRQRYENPKYSERTPRLTVLQKSSSILQLEATDLCKEVLINEEKSSWCRMQESLGLSCNDIKREKLTFTFRYVSNANGYTLHFALEGKVGSGVYIPRNSGYLDMEPDFSSELKDYVEKIRQALLDQLQK